MLQERISSTQPLRIRAPDLVSVLKNTFFPNSKELPETPSTVTMALFKISLRSNYIRIILYGESGTGF
jgi:hypothetical protein